VRDNNEADAELFRQYGVAFKGARQLTWSGKIRNQFPAAQEKTEAACYRRASASQLCIIDAETMFAIDKRGIGELVLDCADEFGINGVIWALNTNGVAISGVFR